MKYTIKKLTVIISKERHLNLYAINRRLSGFRDKLPGNTSYERDDFYLNTRI